MTILDLLVKIYGVSVIPLKQLQQFPDASHWLYVFSKTAKPSAPGSKPKTLASAAVASA
jgi:hypothetical protein